jgi:hypothetical protein
VPEAAITSLKVAALPGKAVHTEKPGPGALSQLYVGPPKGGVPVEALVVFVMLTVPPAQISSPAMTPALFVDENTITSTVVLTAGPQPNVAVRRYL